MKEKEQITTSLQEDTIINNIEQTILYADTSSYKKLYEEDTCATMIEEEEGYIGTPRPYNNNYSNSLFAFLIFALFIISTAIGRKKFSVRRLLNNREESKEEVNHTIIDLIITILLCIITMITSAITMLWYISLNNETLLPILPFKEIMLTTSGIATLFIIQEIVLWLIGEVFFTHKEAKLFCKENVEFYTIISLILTPTIIASAYIYWHANVFIITALILICLMRIIYILRNIKNFKHDISTTCYIILYLCTVEIVPLFILYKWALNN